MIETKILTPTGMMGYGFPIEDFKSGLELKPDVIVVDSGSIDSGPYKLGSGATTCPVSAYEVELNILVSASVDHNIPLMISSAGGAGTNDQVDLFYEIVHRILGEKGSTVKVAKIYSEIKKSVVDKALTDGDVTPCGNYIPDLTTADVDRCENIVAQMGHEPFIDALNKGAGIIIAGRAYDPAPLAAFCIWKGHDAGLAWHMGKIMECGGLCATPSCQSIFGVIRNDHFDLVPLNENSKCTETSVAAHTLYEKSHPYLLPGPGGTADLSKCIFKSIDEKVVRVSGSQFIPAPMTVKLEGASNVGFRSITIAGVRDKNVINALAEIEIMCNMYILQNFPLLKDKFKIKFHQYGRNAVLEEKEFSVIEPHEICVIVEVLADDQNTANQICSKARIALLHAPYTGRKATSGNVAFIFSPLEIPLGGTYEFNIYHIMHNVFSSDLFQVEVV